MALIIYPTTNYDSFCALTDANTILANYMQSSQLTAWNALDDTDKEALLRQSTLLIEQKVGELPTTLESNLQKACAYLANFSIAKTMTDDGTSHNVKEKEIVGVVKTVYFAPNDPQNEFPSIVESLLSGYNITTSGSFVFNRA